MAKAARTKGPRAWERKSPVGRPRLFKSPKQMWAAACEYFVWCEDNPKPEIDYRGKDARKVTLYKKRAITMTGLCLYLDCNEQYFNQFEKSLQGKDDKVSLEFSRVIARIKDVVWDDQFTNAAAGFLKENIISRRLGLADKQEARQVDKDGNDVPQQLPALNITVQTAGIPIATAEE